MKKYYLYDPTTDVINKWCPVPKEQIELMALSDEDAIKFFKQKKDILDSFLMWNETDYDELKFDITPAFYLDSTKPDACVLSDMVVVGFNPILTKKGKNIIPSASHRDFLNNNFYSLNDYKIVRYSSFIKGLQAEGYVIEPQSESFEELVFNMDSPSFRFIVEKIDTKQKKRGF